jgi:hypothetical protein
MEIKDLIQNAVKTYPTADNSGKQILKGLFGEKIFNQKITERVKTFDDVLSIAGKTMEDMTRGCVDEQEVANRKVKLIAEVYNEGEVLDPMNTKQVKYYPWFEITPGSGFGLSYDFCDSWGSNADVGVRLCFKSSELAVDAGKKFTEIYASLLIK